MINHSIAWRSIIAFVLTVFVSACSYIPWFGDDEEVEIELREPLELTDIEAEVLIDQNWHASLGGDIEKTRILLHPHQFEDSIAITETHGKLAVYEASSGRSLVSKNVAKTISAGVGGNEQVLIVGTLDGDVIAVDSDSAESLWSVNVGSEIVAIAHAPGELAIIRSNDNRLLALSLENGEKIWAVSQTSPALTLRGAGVPLVREGVVYAGMDNGRVIAVSIESGNVIWEARVSIPSGRSELDRLVDVDGQLGIDEEFIYAASYHGRVVAMSRINGRISWVRDIASIAGVSVDDAHVYVSDRDDNVWALDKSTGVSSWKQDKLLYRQLSVPMLQNQTLLVGDSEGYLHALSTHDGRIIGRAKLGKAAVSLSPLISHSSAFALDTSGRLTSVTVVPAP